MKVLDFFVDFGDIFRDSLIVLIASLDLFVAHDKEELCDHFVVPDHFTAARSIGVIAQDV